MKKMAHATQKITLIRYDSGQPETPPQILRPGDYTWTWCGKHMDRTDHIWTGHSLICLECHPEKREVR